MSHRISPLKLSPLKLIAAIAFLLVAAGCGADTDVPDSLSMELVVENAAVSVDGNDAPIGEPTEIAFGQSIVLDEGGSGRLDAAPFQFELFKGSDLQPLGADRLNLSAFLRSGHLHIKSDEETEYRVRLTTPNATITTMTRNFELTVCQAPTGLTCLHVVSGEADWLSGGENLTVLQGQSEFAALGEPPGPPLCLSEDDYIKWFDDARRNEPGPDLGELVAAAPSCGEDEEGGPDDEVAEPVDEEGGLDEYSGSKIPTGVGMAAVSVETPVIGTDDFAANPEVYREQTTLDGPISFHIDQRLVSNEDYRAWLISAAGVEAELWTELAPDAWLRSAPEGDPTRATFPTDWDQEPVLGVRSEAAGRFCGFTFKSLATEINWELAAREGVLEDVGLVREWVTGWDEYGPGVPPGMQVLRGQNKVFDQDLYYRSVQADRADQPVARAKVGFRCIADTVLEPKAAEAVPADVPYNDEFCNFDNDWPLFAGDGYDIGYHPPCFYHVESNRTHNEVAVMSGAPFSQLRSVETDVVINEIGSEAGNFRYGLVVGSPSSGYLLFTVRPEDEGDRNYFWWCLQEPSDPILAALESGRPYASSHYPQERDPNRHRGEPCSDSVASGRAEVSSLENTLGIAVGDAGSLVMTIDGTEVGQAPVPMPSGDFGFFVQTYHKDLVHMHYDRLTVVGS